MEGRDFLNPTEEAEFRKMLGRHGKAFSFNPEEIGCVDPKVVEPDGHLHDPTHFVEFNTNPSAKSEDLATNRASKRKGKDENLGTIERSILE